MHVLQAGSDSLSTTREVRNACQEVSVELSALIFQVSRLDYQFLDRTNNARGQDLKTCRGKSFKESDFSRSRCFTTLLLVKQSLWDWCHSNEPCLEGLQRFTVDTLRSSSGDK